VIPVGIAYEADHIYVFSTFGKKIKWMRANPKVCVQVDELKGQADWVSVIVNGEYQELEEPRYSEERNHARQLMVKRRHWWLNAMAERRIQLRDPEIAPLFFRIRVESITGLRAASVKRLKRIFEKKKWSLTAGLRAALDTRSANRGHRARREESDIFAGFPE
jgi:uncharacterized protein